MATIKQVDSVVGAKGAGVGQTQGRPSKRIAMDTPGEGQITKPDNMDVISVRSAAHEADTWSNIGGSAGQHSYDKSKNFSVGGFDLSEGAGEAGEK